MCRFFLYFIFGLLCACQNSGPTASPNKKPLVLVSIAPYADFVEKIAGDTVKLHSVVPSGVNMHLYEPTAQELTLAQHARIWFRVGEPFEERIATILQEHNPQLKIVKLWENIPLLEEDTSSKSHFHKSCEAKDMHIWSSPKLAAIQCATIATALKQLQPEQSDLYALNLQLLEKQLAELDQEIRTLLAPYAGTTLLVSHPAFGYFCREYHLIQLSVEQSGKDPLPKDVEYIFQHAQEFQIQAIFTQSGYNNKGAQLIAEKLGLPIFCVDPYARDYIPNLRHIAELIAYAATRGQR